MMVTQLPSLLFLHHFLTKISVFPPKRAPKRHICSTKSREYYKSAWGRKRYFWFWDVPEFKSGILQCCTGSCGTRRGQAFPRWETYRNGKVLRCWCSLGILDFQIYARCSCVQSFHSWTSKSDPTMPCFNMFDSKCASRIHTYPAPERQGIPKHHLSLDPTFHPSVNSWRATLQQWKFDFVQTSTDFCMCFVWL